MSHRIQHILPLCTAGGEAIGMGSLLSEQKIALGEELVEKYKSMIADFSTMEEQFDALQENLYTQEMLCLSMLQILSEPIFWCNTQYELEGCNDGFCKFFQKERIDILYDNIDTILPKKLAEAIVLHTNTKKHEQKERFVEICYNGELISFFLDTIALYKHTGEMQGYMVHLVNITEIRKKDEQLVYHATHDELTGLSNRFEAKRKVQEFLEKEEAFSVILLNIDKFSDINKVRVPLGDLYLTIFAHRLESIFEGNCIARMGGDEFLILLHETDKSKIEAILHDALTLLKPPVVLEEHEFLQSCSFSISIAPKDADTVEGLLQNVMLTMEYIKQSYGKKIAFFEPFILEALHEQSRREEEIKRALSAKDVINAYQPRLDSRTGTIRSFEALARIRSEDGTIQLPSEFIAEAEHADLIQELGRQVLENACFYVKRLQKVQPGICISVNISAKQFSYDLIDMIDELLHKSGVEPELLELEITESIMIRDVKRASTILEQITSRGIRIAIDDFGKGYSSLYYIKDLPIDTLKIDKDFTQDALSNPRSAGIVRTVITLGRELGMQVVAEGIETAKHYAGIHEYNCTQLQGDYISKPLLEEESFAWISSFYENSVLLKKLQIK